MGWWIVPLVVVPALAGLAGVLRGRAKRSRGETPPPDSVPIQGSTTHSESSPPRAPEAGEAETDFPVHLTLRVPPGSRLRLTVEVLPEKGPGRRPTTIYQTERLVPEMVGPPPSARALWWQGWRTRLAAWASRLAGGVPMPGKESRLGRRLTLDAILFVIALGVYIATRLIHLEDWPIYFFTDEANQTLLALAFVRDGFRDQFGTFLPTYFRNVYQFNLSLSVYAQVIPYLLFSRSVFVTRAVAVLLTVPGAAAIGLTVRDAFRGRYWWAGVFALSLTPAWFLHSRTAFETTLLVSMYACALYFYLRYRSGQPRSIYPAVVLAALAFYSHAAGQIVIVSTAALLLLTDLRYHWQNRRQLAIAALLVVLLALPYARFQITNPGQTAEHLYRLNSYWLQDIPVREKFATLVRNYWIGISPGYWYIPNEGDLQRHLMRGYGHISIWSAPFALVGLVYLLRRVKEGASRAVLLAALTSPLGGVMAGVGITRVLAFTAPAAIITALGFSQVGTWLARRVRYAVLAITAFVLLTLLSFGMLRDALLHGPTWYDDYLIGGLQYGARQVAAAVQEIQEEQPERRVFISPTWANGTDLVMAFLFPDGTEVETRNAESFLEEKLDLSEEMLFVLTPQEYQDLLTDPKVSGVSIERILPYPDGRPGFYFVHMRYSPQADAIFEQERLERLRPVLADVEVDGETVHIEHSLLDMGGIVNILDGDPRTLARGYEANPFRLVLAFDEPRPLSGLLLTTGSMDMGLTVRLYAPGSDEPVEYSQEYRNLPGDPTVEMLFPGAPSQVSRIEIEVGNLNAGDRAKIHLRELVLL